MTGETSEQLRRRSLRLKRYDYSQAGGYYITIVTHGRERLFGEVEGGEMRLNALGSIAQGCWNEIPAHFPNADVDEFVVMPNHVHGIIFIHENTTVGAQHAAPLQPIRGMTINVKPGSLGAILRSFKSAVTRRAGRELNSGNLWQRNYYEHILRNQDDYERVAAYIIANPARWDQDDENPKNLLGAGRITA